MIWSYACISSATQPFSSSLLDEVEYRDAITNRGKETCSVWREEQVASAVDGAKKVGKLQVVSVTGTPAFTRSTNLEVRLHGEVQILFAVIRSITGASWRVTCYDMRLSELFRDSGASSALVKMTARTSAVSPSRDRACRMGDVQKGDPNCPPAPTRPSSTTHPSSRHHAIRSLTVDTHHTPPM